MLSTHDSAKPCCLRFTQRRIAFDIFLCDNLEGLIVRMSTQFMSITPQAIQDLLDELEASKGARITAAPRKHKIIAGDPGVTLLQAADGFVNLGSRPSYRQTDFRERGHLLRPRFVIHFNHLVLRDGRNDPSTVTRVK